MRTDTSINQTIHIDMVWFKGKPVFLKGCDTQGCEHQLRVMHHYGDDGEHYCPTQFVWCPLCGGVGDEPEPFECNKWGVQ